MSQNDRLEQALDALVSRTALSGTPPRLAEAVRYAVFPGGARVRPRLTLAVAGACGEDQPAITDAAAAAIELLHCASLVHDDLPAFDDAAQRRGKPAVHVAFGEPLALLAGDALIVRAFQALAEAASNHPERAARLVALVGAGVGLPAGIVAGQAWECEPSTVLSDYQRAKTGALFAAATMAGALAAGAEPEPWRVLGESIGEAYQVADDILDASADAEAIGKPVGRDQALDRPSAMREMGRRGAVARLRRLVKNALASIPACPGQAELRELMACEADQFVQLALRGRAAA